MESPSVDRIRNRKPASGARRAATILLVGLALIAITANSTDGIASDALSRIAWGLLIAVLGMLAFNLVIRFLAGRNRFMILNFVRVNHRWTSMTQNELYEMWNQVRPESAHQPSRGLFCRDCPVDRYDYALSDGTAVMLITNVPSGPWVDWWGGIMFSNWRSSPTEPANKWKFSLIERRSSNDVWIREPEPDQSDASFGGSAIWRSADGSRKRIDIVEPDGSISVAIYPWADEEEPQTVFGLFAIASVPSGIPAAPSLSTPVTA